MQILVFQIFKAGVLLLQFLSVKRPATWLHDFFFSKRILIHFTSARMEIEVSIGGFNPPWERHKGATHASRLKFCLVFSLIVIQATPAENVWPPRSKSARSQVSAALFYVQTATFVLAWICTDDTQASRRLLASKQKVGDTISVKTLVRWSPGLQDLLRRPCFCSSW